MGLLRTWTTLLVLLAAGCASGANGAAANVTRFCELIDEYNEFKGFVAPPEDTPEELWEEAVHDAFRDYLSLPRTRELLEQLRKAVPAELDTEVDTLLRVASEMMRTGSNRYYDPQTIEANDRVKEYTGLVCKTNTDGGSGG